MIYLRPKGFDIVVECDNIYIVKEIKEFLTFYVPGFRFMPRYQSGSWDGKTSLFNPTERSFPYGLLYHVLKFLKTSNHKDIKIETEIPKLFYGTNIEPVYSLKFQPYDYQDLCIRTALKSSKGIIQSATGSGKSLIITYIIHNLMTNNLIKNALVIVPTKGLITQFCGDMAEYGIPETSLGQIHSSKKEFDKDIVISTWQSLKNRPDWVNQFDGVFVDEVHGVRASVLFDILKNAKKSQWRLGFTGTMPESELDSMKIQSYIGPVLKNITSNDIATLGHISTCNIKLINLCYKNLEIPKHSEYRDIRDIVFKHPFRMNLITHLAKKCPNTLLILVEKVEDEGEYLLSHLNSLGIDKKIVFLHGNVDTSLIEKYRKEAEHNNNLIIIATYGIFSQGINIKALKYIVMAVSYRSKIRVLQSIGRALRTHKDKEDGAYIFDICDDLKVFKRQKGQRKKFYKSEGFGIESINISEGANTTHSFF
jgi:superfamily II DNA or RNA helicase